MEHLFGRLHGGLDRLGRDAPPGGGRGGARDGDGHGRGASEARPRRDLRVPLERQRRRLEPALDGLQRAPDRRSVPHRRIQPPGLDAQRAGTGARLDADPRRDPGGHGGVPVHDRVLADQDHLAVPEAAAVRRARHRGLCASQAASSPVITRGTVASSAADPAPVNRTAARKPSMTPPR